MAAGVPAITEPAGHDLVMFDPDRGWKVVADDFRSKSKNSPFDGQPVQGKVLRTVIDGRCVFSATSGAVS